MKILAFTFFLMLMITEISSAQTPPLEPGVSQMLARWRAANYSDVRYKLNITLEKGAPLMKGEIEISVKLTEEGAKNDLILDWRTTQFGGDKDKPYANVTAVNTTGAQAARLPEREARTETPLYQSTSFQPETSLSVFQTLASEPLALQSNEHLIIPSKYLKTGENVIKINFASPIKTSGAAITRYVDKEDGAEYVYSLFVPSDASTAFPVFDQPDLKARFQLNVKAPKDWALVTNTPFEKWTEESISALKNPKNLDDSNHFVAEETKPISTYVFAFAAGEFKLFEQDLKNKISISDVKDFRTTKFVSSDGLIYVRKSQAEKFMQHAAEVFRLNREGVKFLESYFDYKFPFPKYDIVLIPEFPFGGMEHAGATFLREASVIFPSEPTKNDYISRANVIFHEAAHQWFGDTVTMRWFDDLWLKEGFAEFMAYKTLEKVMPEYNAWKAFYERNKPLAYLTDSTRGTTPIYQEIPNLSAAKSAYGNIVYRKAPAFLRQAEFYLGEDKFQTAVRAFLKKHEYANAEWTDLVKEFEDVAWLDENDMIFPALSANDKKSMESVYRERIRKWAQDWVGKPGVEVFTIRPSTEKGKLAFLIREKKLHAQKFKTLFGYADGKREPFDVVNEDYFDNSVSQELKPNYQRGNEQPIFIFPNYQDYGYGIFLLDAKSRDYVLKNIGAEKDDFLRSMMWGTLWDSVREAELNPRDYVELAIKNFALSPAFTRQNAASNSTQSKSQTVKEKPSEDGTQNVGETDESTIQAILSRVGTAMNYYISESDAAVSEGGNATVRERVNSTGKKNTLPNGRVSTSVRDELVRRLETVLAERITNAKTQGQRITFYRAYLSLASSATAAKNLKDILAGKSKLAVFQLRTKDKFDIVTRLLILGDKDAPQLLANLEKTETSDDAKRYAYAARAGIGTDEAKAKYFRAFLTNKEISESWIEAALGAFNSPKHSALTLQYLETALAELPNLKRTRKIFFVNGWLGAFIGGQKSEEALATVNKFLADNQNLDKDLRLKILENVDNLERAVRIRAKYGK